MIPLLFQRFSSVLLLVVSYLREAADEAAASAGVSVQAVVEEASVTDGHILTADVQLLRDAAPQVRAAAHELHTGRRKDAVFIMSDVFCFISLNSEAATYDIDERRQKHDDDGEDAHQGAVEPGLHDPFGNGLQRDWEHLGKPAGKDQPLKELV